MAYKNGKGHLTIRQKNIRKAVKTKNIQFLLWQLVQDCFEDLECDQEPRHGEQMMKFAIQQLALLESKSKKPTDSASELKISKLREWLDE